ncbi:MAG: hypothetical protein PWQ61_3520 [Betaproteobacteria bacterium]|nr:hypothetical protein [Betaproteobacteria bacterium]
MSLLPAIYHIQVATGAHLHGQDPERTPVAQLRETAHLSQTLERMRRELRMTYRHVDLVAVSSCGRRWCDFRGPEDYRATLVAMGGLYG